MKRSALKRGKPLQRKARLKARKIPKAFRHRRDPAYTRWVRAQPCLLGGQDITRPLSSRDTPNGRSAGFLDGEPITMLTGNAAWRHVCWGPVDPAHVGAHRARGAPDAGAIVPLCRAAHRAYDEHRKRWAHLVMPPVDLQAEAERLYKAYQRETGAP